MEEHDSGSEPSQPSTGVSLERLIERWWENHFPGSTVARHTEAWNVAHAAKESLKELLARARDAMLKGSM
jgi:hypothetical protein